MADYFRMDEVHIDKAWGLHDFDLKFDRPIVFMHGLNRSGRTRACQCIKGMVVMFVCHYQTWVPDFLSKHVTPESEMSMIIGCTEFEDKDENGETKTFHDFDITKPRLKVVFGFYDTGERTDYDDGMRVKVTFERESELGKEDWMPVEYDDDVHDMRYWCSEQTIFDPDDCIHFMKGLPRGMYKAMFDVDPNDKRVSENLARFMPWWALLGDGAENTFAIMDEWFDGLHELLVEHYMDTLSERYELWRLENNMSKTVIISTHKLIRNVMTYDWNSKFDHRNVAFYYITDGTAIRCKNGNELVEKMNEDAESKIKED